jgi:acetylornithine deacetylase/succinyl-diaminopimelate desuccinylase-like protein
VPVEAGEWTKPPFSGLRSGGYIWSRGALDIKSLGIAELMAMIEMKRRSVPLKRDIIYLGVADEELGGLHGCKELLDTRPELFQNVGFVLNESGYNETIVDKVTFWGIEVQQKIPLFLRLEVKGDAGHSASPPEDGGATLQMVRTLEAIASMPRPYRVTPAIAQYFAAVGKVRQDARGEVLRELGQSKIDPKKIEEVLPAGYRSLVQDTVAITEIHAGVCPNCLPRTATANIDIRLLDDERPEPTIARVRSLLPKSAKLDVMLAGEPTPASPSDTELFRVVAKAMQRAEPGSAVAPVVSAGTSDSRYFRARGIVAYGIAPFKVNYYDADTVHGTDERIRATFFPAGVRLTRQIVHDFCAR